jgi:hypothetical protein
LPLENYRKEKEKGKKKKPNNLHRFNHREEQNSYSQKARIQKPLALTTRGTPALGGGDVEPPPPGERRSTEFTLSL